MGEFHFLRPWFLVLILPVAVIYIHVHTLKNPLVKWEKVIHPDLYRHLLLKEGKQSWFNPVNMIFVLAILIVLSLAGPAWETKPSLFSQDEAGLVIGLDLSVSMNQTDVQPSRLERAKYKIQRLLEQRGNSKTALVAYGGTGHTVVPLTHDPQIIVHYLNALATNLMPVPGKVPETVIPLSENFFSSTGVPGTLLLITDGTGRDSQRKFQEYFRQSDHQLIVWAMGKSLDRGAADYLPLERKSLKEMAARSKGKYTEVTLKDTDVAQICKWIDRHWVLAMEEKGFDPWIDAGYYLNFIILLIFVLWFRKGWTVTWSIALILISSGSLDRAVAGEAGFLSLWLTPDQQGYYYFKNKEYETAAERFDDLYWKGVAHYRAKNFKAALALFDRLDTLEGYFALGNTLAQSDHYIYAVKAYARVLRMDPDHEGARQNLEVMQTIIKQVKELSHSESVTAPPVTRLAEDTVLKEREAQKLDQGKNRYSASQLLNDHSLWRLWMRDIQKEPGKFLIKKFDMQLRQQERDTRSQKGLPMNATP